MKFVSGSIMILGLLMSLGATAGVDSSGGGGVAPFRLEMGPMTGSWIVKMAAPPGSSLAAVLKYVKLAGATEAKVSIGTTYTLSGAGFFESNSPPEQKNSMHYQMKLPLSAEELRSVSVVGAEARIKFAGPVAAALYKAMEKNGAHLAGEFRDVDNNNVLGLILDEGRMFTCQKAPEQAQVGGISCFIELSTEVAREQSCDECGG
jgi:hypothetical protein